MATLDTYFASTTALTDVIGRVADLSNRIELDEVNLNDGICSSKELIALADEGARMDFDYARLLEEAETYE